MQKEILKKLRIQILEDLAKLVEIPSLPDLKSRRKYAPFGQPVRNAFDAFASIAKEKGFHVEDDEGYAISASIGKKDGDYIGVLGHLDVVDAGDPALWDSEPYHMAEHDGMLYGRGVNDDKGPLLAALYAAWLIKEQELPLRHEIRIIAGGAEETTWECMDHYFQHHKQPLYGFSPDGNFPIVNGEKGILQVRFQFPQTSIVRMRCRERLNYVCDHVEMTLPVTSEPCTFPHAASVHKDNDGIHITYEGKTALSRNPQRGVNALFDLVKDMQSIETDRAFHDCMQLMNDAFVDDFYGEKSGIYAQDVSMGTTSVCPMSLQIDEDVFELCVDIRYVRTTDHKIIMKRLLELAETYHADVEILKHKRLLFVEEDSELIQALKKAYRVVMHEEADVLTKGGASYARVLDRGVAFGATFPDEDPKPHMPNECMPVASLLKACEIYYEALCELAVGE